MITNIKVRFDDKLNLLKMLESVGVPFEMNYDIISVDSNKDMKIIAALTLNHYDYSVTYGKEA